MRAKNLILIIGALIIPILLVLNILNGSFLNEENDPNPIKLTYFLRITADADIGFQDTYLEITKMVNQFQAIGTSDNFWENAGFFFEAMWTATLLPITALKEVFTNIYEVFYYFFNLIGKEIPR